MVDSMLPGTLVSAEWLAERLGEPGLRVVDIRGYVKTEDLGGGRQHAEYVGAGDEYEREHIPGAVFVDWTLDITDPDHPVKAQLAPPERFAEAMGTRGIDDATDVVVVDHTGGHFATRLWWALKTYGHERVAVLDGSALPRAYRQPIIACHLQGLSRTEAAKQLNLNEGTLSSRLARAREMLAANLKRRGLAPAAIAVILALNARSASAAITPELVSATVKAATAYGKAGGGAAAALAASKSAGVSGGATALASAVLKGMALAKLKLAGLITALLLFVTAGVLIYVQTRPPSPVPGNDILIVEPAANPPDADAAANKPEYTGTPR
jgi:rhodanese-related sulfurtransferase